MRTPSNRRWKTSAKSIAAVMILMSATGCFKTTPDPNLQTILNSLCAFYPDKEHPPVWIEEDDSKDEKEAKIDFLIAWEVECGIKG